MKKNVFLSVALLVLMAVGAFAQTDDMAWKAVENSPFGTSAVYDIVFASNTFVAVGAAGKIAYSTNGQTFVAVANSQFGTSAIRAVAFGGNRFVAVGDAGKAAYSADGGRTWTAVANTGFGTSNILGVAWGGNRFVAVGQAGKIATSTNGQTWTMVPAASQPTRGNLVAVAFGNNRFVIAEGEYECKMWYSADGAAWTAVRDTGFSYDGGDNIVNITWANNMFFAVGANGSKGASAWSHLAYSRDGVTWTPPTENSGLIAMTVNDVAFAAGRYVAVQDYGIYYSTDNVTWRYINADYNVIGGGFRGVAYGANRFVVAGPRGALAYLDWTAR